MKKISQRWVIILLCLDLLVLLITAFCISYCNLIDFTDGSYLQTLFYFDSLSGKSYFYFQSLVNDYGLDMAQVCSGDKLSTQMCSTLKMAWLSNSIFLLCLLISAFLTLVTIFYSFYQLRGHYNTRANLIHFLQVIFNFLSLPLWLVSSLGWSIF